MHPGETFHPGYHCDAITHALDEITAGRRPRQIINASPRSTKSFLVSTCWTAFLLGMDPTLEILCVSYTEPLANRLSADTRRLMKSAFYRDVFPDTILDQASAMMLTTTEGGRRFATTIGGAVTGFGGRIIIIDDPINGIDALSEVARDRVNTYFQQSLASRPTPPAEGVIVVVGQRFHENDLSGFLLEKGGWDHLKLQAIATEDAQIPIGSGRYQTVRTGDLMLPSFLTPKFLDDQKLALGSAGFAAQYLQEPAPAEGAMVKRHWLRYADPPDLSSGIVTLSVDAASKTGQNNDYSVCTVWLNRDGKHYLYDLWRDRVDITQLLPRIETLVGQYKPLRVLIEDASAGTQLIQFLARGGVPATACKADRAKDVRLYGVLPYFENGLVILPKSAPWLDAFVDELLRFPGGRHDDQVDSVSQYLSHWLANPPSTFSYDMMNDDPIDHGATGERYAISLAR
jgi:predicted phage terminase large subunit-like protein